MVVALLLLALTAPLQAQVNIETYRGRQGITGGARFSLSSDLGNVDVVNSDGAGYITVNAKNSVFLGVFKGGVGFLGGKSFANSGVLHLRWTFVANPRYQPELFAQADYAKPRRLDDRALAGAGLRFNAYEAEKSSLSFGSALMWEHEGLDLVPGDQHPATTDLVRWSTYVNLSLQGKIGFATTAYVQPALSDPGDVRVLGTAELSTPIIGPLRQTTSVDFRIDSAPPQGVEKEDFKFGTSFGVVF
jgi:hypothetical protein